MRQRRKIRTVTALVLTFILLTSFYTNCAGTESLQDPSQTSSGSNAPNGPVRTINDLREPRPDLIQGKEGYSYLLSEYLRTNCFDCHDDKAFTKIPLAAFDEEMAYNSALSFSKDVFLNSVTQNRFCITDCNLSPQGEVYKAIAEWLDHRK